MIRAKFFHCNGQIAGFEISGHADYADSGKDVVCAGVSSAVMLVINIVNEGFCTKSDVTDKGESIEFKLRENSSEAQTVLEQFCEHLKLLSSEYKGTIKIENMEV